MIGLCLAGLVLMGLAGIATIRRRPTTPMDVERSGSRPAAGRRTSVWTVPRVHTAGPAASVPVVGRSPGASGLLVLVEDILGGPIGGAQVAVGEVNVAATDASGTAYVAAGSVPHSGLLRVSAEGYAPDEVDYRLPGEVNVWLLPGSQLGGVVVAAGTETPVGGLQVTANGRDTTSDDEGRFLFRDLPAESYRLEARGRHHFGVLPHPVALGPGRSVTGLRLEVQSAFAIRGRVRARGQPLPDRLMVKGGGTTSAIDGDGRYQLLGVPPGRYDVGIKHEGGTLFALGARPRVRVVDRDVVQDIELGERFELEVEVVTSRGTPVAGLRVHASQKSEHREVSVACLTDVTGRCRVTGCQRGALEVEVDAAGSDRKVALPAQGPIRLVVDASAQLSGRLVTPSGRPPRARGVSLDGPDGRGIGSVWSEPDGRFSFRPLPDGRYTVRVTEQQGILSPDTGVEATAQVTLEQGDDHDLVITLADEDGRIAGRVVDLTGKPVADVLVSHQVFVRNFLDNRAVLGRPVVTSEDGRFEFTGLIRHYHHRVLAYRASGERAEAVDVAPGAPPLTLRLQPLSTLTVLVQGESGVSDSASVTVYDGDELVGWNHSETPPIRFDSLTPGRRRVEAKYGRSRAEAVVDLQPGAAQTVRLTLR
jgi:hypothetical protein